MKCKRIYLCAKDLQDIAGISQSQAYKQLQHLKDALGKKGHQKVTIKEYSEYMGVSIAEIEGVLFN